jgi:hypothetical protein
MDARRAAKVRVRYIRTVITPLAAKLGLERLHSCLCFHNVIEFVDYVSPRIVLPRVPFAIL